MTQGDGFDRIFGTGAPAPKPLDAAKPVQAKKTDIVWTTVADRPWIEQSNETPPKMRTKHYHQGRP